MLIASAGRLTGAIDAAPWPERATESNGLKNIAGVRTTRSLVPRPPQKLVLGLWVAVLVVGSGLSGRGRRRVPRRVQPARRRVQDRLRHPRRRSSAARAPGIIGTIVFRGRAGRRRPRGPGGDAGAVRRGRERSRTSSGSRAPTPRAASRRSRREGRDAGQDRLRQRRDARRHRLPAGRRDPRRDPRRHAPRSTACGSSSAGSSSPSSRSRRPRCSASPSPSSS